MASQKTSACSKASHNHRQSILLKLIRQNNIPVAQQTLAQWLEETPDDINILYFSGFWAYQANDIALAIQCLHRVTETLRQTKKPVPLWFNTAEADYYLGLSWYKAGQAIKAIDSFWIGLRCPNLTTELRAQFHAMSGLVHNACGFNNEAQFHLSRATELEPGNPVFWKNLAHYYDRMFMFNQAKNAFEQALKLYQHNPDTCTEVDAAELTLNLARISAQMNQWDLSQQYYQAVLDASPSLNVILETACQLPAVYPSCQSIETHRQHYINQLSELLNQPNMLPANDALKQLDQLYSSPVFGLPYQGLNDKTIASDMGQLLTRWISPETRQNIDFNQYQRDTSTPMRIGFISRYLKPDCSVGKLYLSLINALTKRGVEVYLLHIETVFQPHVHTQWQKNDNLIVGHLPADNTFMAVQLLQQAKLDIAFYPDLSTDTSAMLMGLHRVAPVQCTSWGHANTSGFPSMDAYLSSEHLEIEQAQSHYSETLITLPTLPTLYQPPTLSRWHRGKNLRDSIGLPPEAVIYLCPQSLFKLHPDFDAVINQLLLNDPDGYVVFIDDLNSSLQSNLLARFSKSLHATAMARVKIAPRCKSDTFLHWLNQANVILDPIHFGGGNTTLEAMAIGTPVVTCPGEFMRSRITSGCYKLMECDHLKTELIAHSVDEYTEKAMRVAHSPQIRQQCHDLIKEHAHHLWNEEKTADAFIQAFSNLLQAASNPTNPETLLEYSA